MGHSPHLSYKLAIRSKRICRSSARGFLADMTNRSAIASLQGMRHRQGCYDIAGKIVSVWPCPQSVIGGATDSRACRSYRSQPQLETVCGLWRQRGYCGDGPWSQSCTLLYRSIGECKRGQEIHVNALARRGTRSAGLLYLKHGAWLWTKSSIGNAGENMSSLRAAIQLFVFRR